MTSSKTTIRNGHLVTIFVHLIMALLILWFVYKDNKMGAYVVGGLLLGISFLAFIPILQSDYECEKV